MNQLIILIFVSSKQLFFGQLTNLAWFNIAKFFEGREVPNSPIRVLLNYLLICMLRSKSCCTWACLEITVRPGQDSTKTQLPSQTSTNSQVSVH